MKYLVNNLRLPLDCDMEDLKQAASRKLGIKAENIKSFRIAKESVDARRKPNISLVYSIVADIDSPSVKPLADDVKPVNETVEQFTPGNQKLNKRPVIVGFGPAGMFAGLILAVNGYRPLIIERGQSVGKRTGIVKSYWENGKLDYETNVQFGEGGAGTFSDGKLTTRINDRRCDRVLEELEKAGAPEEILYKARPHIGSDNLKLVVANIRNKIIDLGGEVRFNTRLERITIRNSRVTGISAGGEDIEAGVVILAIGHSARDTFKSLLNAGISFIQKPFSIGVRIEHPQELINRAQYGSLAGHPRLGAADYQLFYKTSGRTVYSFCMCPGGVVVASASEPDTIVTNGMSGFARNMENANSALVVSVEPGDFGSSHPLAGVEFQRKWEQQAFIAGGRDNSAPIQRLEDFINGVSSGKIGSVKPSYTGKTRITDINTCLPVFVTDPMKQSISYFDRILKGFGIKDALLTGVETRTSSPVRIPRSDSLEALDVKGLYPAGEGAGYAGGIVSAAVDGIRIAEQIIKTYAPPE